MNAQEILYKFQMEKFEIFKSQDPENGKFDVVFEIDGKKLYANKYMLCTTSTTLESMLSDRWTKSNEPIPLHGHTFEDFKEFLTFLYSGKCSLTDNSIFAMVDIAEFYNVTVFKEICEEYLTKMEINLNNVYQIIDVADKYFMTQVKRSIHAFIPNNLSDFVQSEHFLNLDKSILKEIVESFPILSEKEVLFEAVYKWAENQAIKKQRLDETLNLNETIKEEFSHVFPFVRIGKMDLDFIVKFVWQKSFLFSDEELKKLILDQSKVHVIIIDGDTKVMKGVLQCPDMEKVIDVIREQTFCVSRSLYYYWDAKQPKPSTPSKLNKDESIEWYLLYDKNGNLAIKHCDEVLDDDYLLAEMFADQDFGFHGVCKIQIV